MTPKKDAPQVPETPVKPLPTHGGEYLTDSETGEHIPVAPPEKE